MTYDIAHSLQHLRGLHDKVGQFLNDCGHEPAPNSQADIELHNFQRAESLITAYSQGRVLIEVVADQLTAFIKTVTEPAQSIAPWTCIRALLEASALASWLLDPSIDPKLRVQRSLAFRYEGLSQQVKLGQAMSDEANTAKVIKRIDDVEHVALGLGFPKLRNKKGERTGIGQQMPSITDLIGQALNEEVVYRILSAMAHAHPWALQQLSFRRADDDTPKFWGSGGGKVTVHSLEKNLDAISAAVMASKAANHFARPVWYKCQLFGWDLQILEHLLDDTFNAMRIGESSRFWKSSGSKASG